MKLAVIFLLFLQDSVFTLTNEGPHCGPPPSLENGHFLTSTIQYQCQSQYVMQGGPYKTCLNGVWTGEIKCLKVTCELPAPNPKVNIVGAEGERVTAGNMVTVQCVTGGSSEQLECLSTGQWSSTFPSCNDTQIHPVTSCTLTDFKQSTIFNDNFNIDKLKETYAAGETVTVPCKDGFSGSLKMICSSGQWYHRGNKCRNSCAVEDVPDSVVFSPHNVRQLQSGQRLVFRCKDGSHILRGAASVTCLEDGQWSHTFPSCADTCDVEHVPDSVVFSPHNVRQLQSGQRLVFRCKDGSHILHGAASVTCLEHGEWSHPFPSCAEVTCELPASSTKVNILGLKSDRVSAGNSITVQCVTGGSSKQLECLSTGQWSSTFPSCADTCDVENVPDSVVFTPRHVNQFQIGQRLEFRCKDGSHILRGAESVTCLENGQWSHLYPSCAEVTCELPAPNPKVNILGVEGERVTAGNSITVQCVTGGSSKQLECLSTGQWSSTFPSCAEVTCDLPAPSPKVNIFGADGDQVPAGNRIIVQCVTWGVFKQLTCLSTGQWSSTFPTCPDTCNVEHIPDSVVYFPPVVRQLQSKQRLELLLGPRNVRPLQSGQRLVFRCKDGSQILRGAESVTCLENGQWSHPFPSCAEVTCELPAPSTKVNILGVEGERVTAGNNITVQCVTGGSSKQLECLSTGQWSSTFPSCNVTCGVEHVPDSVVFSPRNVRQLQSGQSLTFHCKDGSHILRGAESVTCLESGQWSHTFPSCAGVTCELPASNPKVTILGAEGERVTAGNMITVQCVTGGSSKQLQCLSTGQWSSTFPSCNEVTCELPAPNPKVNILGVKGDRVTAGNRITVQCVAGGRSKQLECLSTGQWSSTFPSCADSCAVEHVPDSVLFFPRHVRQLRNGERLEFHCKDPLHIIRGAASVTCLEDGEWSHPFPSCAHPQNCGSPPSLDNGDYLVSNTVSVHNTKVEYICQYKYVMEGGPYKTCHDGEWTGEITCLKPCTINQELMEPNKIKFRSRNINKLYVPHDEYLTVKCVEGATHDGFVEMRQKCNNGVMVLPRCV